MSDRAQDFLWWQKEREALLAEHDRLAAELAQAERDWADQRQRAVAAEATAVWEAERADRLDALITAHHAAGVMDGVRAGDVCPVCVPPSGAALGRIPTGDVGASGGEA